MKFDENEIRKAISIMKPQNSLFEIRVIAAGGGNASGYFRDADTCINAMRGIRMVPLIPFYDLSSIIYQLTRRFLFL